MAQEDLGINPTLLKGYAEAKMPQDPEAEVSVLSAMMLSRDALEQAMITLTPEDFYIPSNRIIYVAIREMFDKNMPIDAISLADYLRSKNLLEKVGGPATLVDLSNYSLSLGAWERHIEMLHRDTTLRKMISAAAQVTALAYDAPEDTKEVVDRAEKLILDVSNRDVQKTEQTLEEIFNDFYDDLTDLSMSGEEFAGVKTGFPTLDRTLLGMRPGQMVVIGARPGVGKTSLALNLAVNAAWNGATVAFFSLEMSKTEIAQRLLSAETSIGLREIRSGKINNEQWKLISDAIKDMSVLPMIIDDTPGTTVTEIRAKARRILSKANLGLIVIDYLQLLSPPSGVKRADSRATEVAEMSRGIKIMAKDLGVPVIALSQLNRTLENRTGKRPQLSDLRESGAIEQDADIVILLDRSTTEEEAKREDRPNMDETTMIIAKNRSGETRDVSITFKPGSTKFVEVTVERQ